MATHIHKHVDGKLYRRDFVTGRRKSPPEIKCQHQMISLPPNLKREVKDWKERTGKSFSEWIADQMRDTIYTETVQP
jgi:hypothetical protein